MEIHVELNTRSKMFCSCKNDSDEKRANFNICPVCTAQPGTLPVINKEAVRKTIKTGLALNCQIPESSKFDRKNYFYPDLPKGYQISQYDRPFCKEGFLELEEAIRGRAPQKLKKIRITRVHLEEDTGRLIHQKDASLVDFNRAGIPLMELVTEPDLNFGQEARKFAQELQLLLRYLEASGADMEKGQMRVEVNISLLPLKSQIPAYPAGRPNPKSQTNPIPQNAGQKLKLGTKVEIKNLNSFRSVEKAINYEIKRQAEILDKGKKVIQETRGWNEKKQATVSQREKEEAHDYRYFPEPDLPTVHLKNDFINKIKAEIPELPREKRKRFEKEYGLDPKIIEIFVGNKDLGEYFEKVISELRNWIKEAEMKEKISNREFLKLAKLGANYIITDFWTLFESASILEFEKRVNPENFAELIKMIYKNEISSKIAKKVLKEMFNKGADPSHIIEDRGLSQLGDEKEIKKIVKEVVSKNKKAVEDYKKGKTTAFQFLIGQVMSGTRGRAKPDIAQKLLKKELSSLQGT